MDDHKTNALLKWVNSVEIGEPINSLQQLSSGHLLLKMLHFLDKDYQTEEVQSNIEKNDDLHKVLSYLENFYQQSLTSFIDENEISSKENVMEIGKVVSLLLYCAIEGDNVSVFVEQIKNMDEDTQIQIKIVIETVLKEVNCGKINMANITSVLGQSGSGRENQECENCEYQSSPIVSITSPGFQLKSPIKALMASPQMQSRQSQATISKLYKKLYQLQMKINTQSNLENELKEKTQQIDRQDLKISSLLKEVAKIRGLEDEVQSLSCCEKELADVKYECERLKKMIQQLQTYKQQFLKLENDFSDYESEKNVEKTALENQLREMKKTSQERILSLEELLEEENLNNKRVRVRLLEASSGEAAMKEKVNNIKAAYELEFEKLKTSLDESKRREDEVLQMKNEELFLQIGRENELRNCFKEKEASLEEAADQLQLQNVHLHQDIEQIRRELNEKEMLRKTLECDLGSKQLELTNVVCKYECLQTDFNSLECESKNLEDQLQGANGMLLDEKRLLQVETESYLRKLSSKDEEIEKLSDENEKFQNGSAEKDLELQRLETLIKEQEEEVFKEYKKKEELQIGRENELRNCFKEKEASLEEAADQLQLQNVHLHQDIEQIRRELNEKEMLRKTLECDLGSKQLELTNVVCKYECLQSDFNSLECESKNLEDQLQGANGMLLDEKRLLQVETESYLRKLSSKDEEIEKLSDENEKFQNGSAEKDLELQRLETLIKEQEEEVFKEYKKKEELQIGRENELRNCFKEKEASLEEAADQLQLQNVHLHQDIEQIRRELNEKEMLRKTLECDLGSKQLELTNVVCKYECLQSDFNSLECESKNLEDQLQGANGMLLGEKRLLQVETESYLRKLSSKDEEIEKLSDENEKFQNGLAEKDLELQRLETLINEQEEEVLKEYKKKEELQIGRENELRNCFKEKEASLEEQNVHLHQDIEQIRRELNEKEMLRKTLECDLGSKQLELTNVVCKYECLQTDFNSLECESKNLEDQLQGANGMLLDEKRLLQVETESYLRKLSSKGEDIEKLSDENEKFQNGLAEKLLELQRLETLIKEQQEQVFKEHKKKEELVENSRHLVGDLEDEKKRNAEILRQCEEFQHSLNASADEKASLMDENLSLKKKVKDLELLSKESEYVQICLKYSCEEKELLVKENAALQEKIKHINLEANHNKEIVGVMLQENQLFKSKFTATTSTLNALRHQLKETRGLFWMRREEITTMHDDFKDCHEKLVNQHTQCKQKLSEKERSLLTSEQEKGVIQVELEKVMKIALTSESQAKIIEDKDAEIKRFREEEATIQKENDTLNEIQERNKEECLEEHQRAESLKRQLADSENEIKKLNEEASHLKMESQDETLKFHKKMEFIGKENCRFKEHICKLEENVDDLEKQLVEEELISKRLGLEVTSLDAQLLSAVRQLRQRQSTKETVLKHKGEDRSRIMGIATKLSVSENCIISEAKPDECSEKIETLDDQQEKNKENVELPPPGKREPNVGQQNNSVLFETKGYNEVETIRKENSAELGVSEESIVSEVNLKECSEKREMAGEKNQDREAAEVPKHDDDDERGKPRGRIRRRSALYQTTGNNEVDMAEKRRSTVGGTFFVVDEYTTQDEPTLFDCDYDWERILELQRRNATCLPHMRSTYPVEEVHIEEKELTSCLSRKRLRDNASDSNLSVTFHIPNDTKTRDNRALPKSKSDNIINGMESCRRSKRFPEKMAAKLNSLKPKSTSDENCKLLSSTFSLDQSTSSNNNEHFVRRESIAFNVELSPPKKSRSTRQRSIHRSFGKSDLSLVEKNETSRNNPKEKFPGLKKFQLPRKPSAVKSDKKPLTSAN